MKSMLIDAGFHSTVEPLRHALVRDVEGVLYLLWGGAAFVLLVGGLNVANLVLARLSVRAKETATRLALGASRARIVRQSIVENVLLTAAGGVAGVVAGSALLRALSSLGLERFPRADEVRVDASVVLVSLGVALVLGVLIGLAPLASLRAPSLSGMLGDGGRTRTGGRGTRTLRHALVCAEIGFAFVLLVAAGLLLESFRRLLAVDPGFRTSGVLTASTDLPRARYRSEAEVRALMGRTLASIRRVPGVAAAGATTSIPFGSSRSDGVILAEGYTMRPGESVIAPRSLMVTPRLL